MPAAAVAFYLAYANAAFGVFNLIPGFPLDGGRVLRAAVWAMTDDLDRATRLAVRAGRVAAGTMVAFGAWQALGGGSASGLWLILVGWFLWSAAEQEGMRATLESALRGQTVGTFVRRQIVVLDANSTVADAVERIVAASPQALYPVLATDALLGALTPHDIAHFPAERRPSTSLNWLARRVAGLPILALEADAIEALKTLDELPTDALPVADASGRFVGIFERGAVLRWLQLRRTLTA
jgi:CBS domain-containing protein